MGNSQEFGQGEKVLSHGAGKVTEAKADFERMARTLEGQISAVKWGGAGAQAFTTLHQAWMEKHKVVVSALDRFAAELTATEKDNERVDQEQQGYMTNLLNKLGDVKNA